MNLFSYMFTINNRFMAMINPRNGMNVEPTALLRQDDYVRQTKQNLSILFKAVLKYIFINIDRMRTQQ